MESSSAFTRPQSIPVPAWVSPSANALLSAPEGESGLSLNPEEAQHFSLSFREEKDNEPLSGHRPPQIVLVEDSAADIGLVREALSEHKVECELTVITNGERAVRLLAEIEAGEHACPALFIIDLNLPKKPGRVVLQRVRDSAVCGHVPAIVLSSSDSQKDKDDVAAFGPSQYIRKPSKLDDFIRLGAVFKQILYPSQ